MVVMSLEFVEFCLFSLERQGLGPAAEVVCTCDPSTWEVDQEDWGAQGYPQLHSEFEASLDI